jgi:transcriptional regulator with XRE-family HTH domain
MTENPIAKRIQVLLDERNESRKSLAETSGVAYDRLRNLFKRAGAKPSADDLGRIALHFGTRPEFLLHGGEEPSRDDPLRLEAARQLDLLSDEEVRTLLVGLKLTTADRQ